MRSELGLIATLRPTTVWVVAADAEAAVAAVVAAAADVAAAAAAAAAADAAAAVAAVAVAVVDAVAAWVKARTSFTGLIAFLSQTAEPQAIEAAANNQCFSHTHTQFHQSCFCSTYGGDSIYHATISQHVRWQLLQRQHRLEFECSDVRKAGSELTDQV